MSNLAALEHEAVIVARDLTPSQTVGFDRERVVAFATDAGGKTSHTAIVARALGIPAVVGLERVTDGAEDGVTIIVDGDRGAVILDPDEPTIQEYRRYGESMRVYRASLAGLADEPAVTRDGVRIHLFGNIEFPSEIEAVLLNGGDGVGLFRTEFLYLAREVEPEEQDHFEAYRLCVERLKGRPLTIRTMDLGADKYTQAQAEDPERNPALGLRSIRYCLQNLPLFRRQLRAILRASALGPVRMMFPLVTNTLEMRQARMIVGDLMEDLDEEGVKFDRRIPLGMMVEAPSAAIMAPTFAREVDFFSIGTNDLVQYTLAVDRTNERVASLYSAAHPAVIRLMKDVVRAARRHKTPVSICGEAAGDVEFTMLLIGIGLRSLSVTPSLIPHVKRVVRGVDVEECERLARKVGSFDSERQITACLRERTRAIIPEAFDGRAVEEK
jgi:phosphotransferase system enzyme I (PtsI)